MLHKLPGLGAPDIDGVYWTLCIELWFYVLMLALFATGQLPHIERYRAVVLIAALVLWAAQLIVEPHPFGWAATAAANRALPFLPMFIVGICIYRLARGERQHQALGLLLAALAVIAATLPLAYPLATLVAVAVFTLIPTNRAPILRHPALVWLGTSSYTLSLVHDYAGRAHSAARAGRLVGTCRNPRGEPGSDRSRRAPDLYRGTSGAARASHRLPRSLRPGHAAPRS